MRIFTKALGAAAMALTVASASASVGMYIGVESIDQAGSQEQAAARWFAETYTDGVIITPSNLAKINPAEIKALWVNIDRLAIGKGVENLPAEFSNADFKAALTNYVKDGGNLYLSKFATQLVPTVGRIPEAYAPGIFGDGDGGVGTDVWCVNAYFGMCNYGIDDTQIYDRRNHAIYEGMEAFEANSALGNYPHPSFPLLGTGTGEGIHREDHNCMWDLNAYSWDAEGKNTMEKMEAQFDCQVIGTWGHVQDYCVAGIVDFNPTADIKGRIVANGLAAYEWAPRTANNAYHNNITRLTENTLNYLGAKSTGINAVEEADTEAVYYTLQGVKTLNPENGIYIVVKGNNATKVVVK